MIYEDNRNQLFQKHFPEGRIEWIAYSALPEKAIRRFEGMSARFILPEDYREGDFTGLFVVHHDDGMKTYLARQIKDYSVGEEPSYIEELVYLYEMNGDIVIGNGELRYSPEK
ncbi:hypothetical protein KY326_03830, partial [Candidatus Woesearchaeota archaeon]|nr:hypothetical protein [Candidatus Woesearchaeota archaeon]